MVHLTVYVVNIRKCEGGLTWYDMVIKASRRGTDIAASAWILTTGVGREAGRLESFHFKVLPGEVSEEAVVLDLGDAAAEA